MEKFIDKLFIFFGLIKCYECHGASGKPAHRTKGGACLCVPCRNRLMKRWGIA